MCETNNLELGTDVIFEDMTEEEKVDFLSHCSDDYEEDEYEEEKYPLIEEQMELLALAEETSRLSNLKMIMKYLKKQKKINSLKMEW